MAYNPIVEVNISLESSGLTAESFGIPLIMVEVDITTDGNPLSGVDSGTLVKSYSNLEEVLTDFEPGSAAVLAAGHFFSKDVAPSVIKIGLRDLGTSAFAAVSEVANQDGEFFFLIAESKDAEDVHGSTSFAAYAEASDKMYFFSSDEEAALTVYTEGTSTDLLAKVREEAYVNTKGFFSHQADDMIEAAYLGEFCTYLAGSVSWESVAVRGIAVSQDPSTSLALSTTQRGYLEARNAAYTERLGPNTVVVRNALTAGGEYIDIIHGKVALTSDLSLSVADLLARQRGSKLPFTNDGISALENVIDQVLYRYSVNPRNYLLEYTTTFPGVEAVPVLDRNARVYRQGRFRASVQGAVGRFILSGTVSASLL